MRPLPCVLLCMATSALAEYPERPIRLIVASAPGGQPDINSRLFAAELTKRFNQQIVIDNRAGAAGLLGTELLAKSSPDGYTLSYVAFGLATNPALRKNLPYDLARDLQLVILTHISPNVLAVAPALPVKSVTELIAHAKQNPGRLNFGTGGTGASSHIGMELFMQMTGAPLTHVPYKGVQQAVTDIIGGQCHVISDNASPIMAHVAAGRLRALGVTGTKRIPLAPELPTVAEAGVPGYEITPWGGYAVPARTPAAIVARLNSEFNRIVAMPAIRDKWIAVGIEPVGGTPEHFTGHVRRETAKWGEVIRKAGIKVE